MWKETIKLENVYDFDQALDRLAIDPLHLINVEKRSVRLPIYETNEVVVVKGIGTSNEPAFEVSGSQEETKEIVLAEVARIFQWHAPLTAIHEHFQATDLREIFNERKGTPRVLDFSPYACLVKCIVHQQLNLKFAHTLTERFVHAYGYEHDGVWFYPSPETVAQISIEELRSLQFSQRKAEYLVGLSQLIVENELKLHELETLSDEEVVRTLVKIRGVGPWTAQNFLMFALGRDNLFPKADIGLQKAVQKLYQLDKKPTLDEMDKYSQNWEPYLSYASLYLWRSIE
ncbi:DNA-3-methyladenine glycosylase family protein [Bacillus sp. FJAT-42315]|uniref:DNA-3-methyladenine glycosylase family protein n=1 Tax=Bacillus sp. FJAT-42315 TaxID=2014077 RepID=UPI000C24E691|nr:DNA-3-methyladenine glycosylase [Bacillus sp. FJAT-42315]